MTTLARWVVRHRWWVLAGWVLLTVLGAVAAPKATSALGYDFSLPGRSASETDEELLRLFGSGGESAPVLLVVDGGGEPVPREASAEVEAAVAAAGDRVGGRVVGFGDQSALRADDGRLGVVLVYPAPVPGEQAYAAALPALQQAADAATDRTGLSVTVTGQDALVDDSGSGGGGALAETVLGAAGALIVLTVVFGSFLALTPLLVAAASILTTFLLLWGLTALTDVSFIVQYLLALIGLGVAIDYALLIVTRWREERGNGLTDEEAVTRALATAGRSVVFSGVTVAVSLAALIALPVPFLRSVGFTGLLIPVVSVVAAVTLLPALLTVAGPKLSWPHRRRSSPDSRLWHGVATAVVRHRWIAALLSAAVLLALASPALGLRLGQPSNDSLVSAGGPTAAALEQVERSGIGDGVTAPVEILTDDPAGALRAATGVEGVAGGVAPAKWRADGLWAVDVWTAADPASGDGEQVVSEVREVLEARGDRVGGIGPQNADFVDAVYGNAWWIAIMIVVVTYLLLARALRSVLLPLKALVLNVLSIGAAYGVTVLIWQYGVGTELLFGQTASDSLTVWVPVAVFAFLFGLSMDYEVFLLSRIREEHEAGRDTDTAVVHGVARTGRLITSAALILFLAFVALSRAPGTDVKILATGLALGILIDATVVRGVLAPALVAAMGRANWWWPFGDGHRGPTRTGGTGAGPGA